MHKVALLSCCLLVLALAQTENMEDCSIMPDEKCKKSSLCQWRQPQCRIGVTNCDGLAAPICNAADSCKLEIGEGTTCRGTSCLSAYTSGECRSYNTYSNDCFWNDIEKRCISNNTCRVQGDQESCRGLSGHGCMWNGSKGCIPHDPCGGKSPTQCMSDGAAYKCWTTPGDCYGNAVGNLDKKIKEGAGYTIALEENFLAHNDKL